MLRLAKEKEENDLSASLINKSGGGEHELVTQQKHEEPKKSRSGKKLWGSIRTKSKIMGKVSLAVCKWAALARL